MSGREDQAVGYPAGLSRCAARPQAVRLSGPRRRAGAAFAASLRVPTLRARHAAPPQCTRTRRTGNSPQHRVTRKSPPLSSDLPRQT